jgi:superfamily II DNA helicase RecQ
MPLPKSSAGVQRSDKTIDEILDGVKNRLNLPFEVSRWQGYVIQRLTEGHDCIAIAGTGRGKSLVWEGFAGIRDPEECAIVLVIEPLKSIQVDMVRYHQVI